MKRALLSWVILCCWTSIDAQQAGFTFNQPSKCVPSTVDFVNTSTGNPNGYQWDFGDGFTSTTPNPSHPYTNAGLYTVRLIAFYPDNISDTVVTTIEVLRLPVFTYTLSKDSICPEEFVTFTSSVSYPSSPQAIRSYYWDFGDGGMGTTPNPAYQYKNIANLADWYNVSLTVTDTNGCSAKLQLDSVFARPKPIIDFEVDRQFFCYPVDSPAVAHFVNRTTVTNNNTYYWIFSNGDVSSLENPVITFQNQGRYSVSLTATSPEGCTNTLSKAGFVEVSTFLIRYTVSDTILCAVPGTVTFQGTNGGQTRYYWYYGDGTMDSTFFVPTPHTYDSAGTYQVSIMAKNSNGCLSYDTLTIHVYDSVSPEMYVNPRDTNLCDPNDTVTFINNTVYPSNDDFGFGTTVWDFGDSVTASGDSVTHIYGGQYGDRAHYKVTMYATTPYGCKLEAVQLIHIFPIHTRPIAGLYEGCVPHTIGGLIYSDSIFETSSPLTNHIWHWDSLHNPNDKFDAYPKEDVLHTYTDTGTYHVYLTLINEQGCVATFFVTIVDVGLPTSVGFTSTYREDCYFNYKNDPFEVYPFDSVDINGDPVAGIFAEVYEWYDEMYLFSSSLPVVPLPPMGLGYRTITMTGYHNGCRTSVVVDSVYYVCPPIAFFYIDQYYLPPRTVCGYDSVHFNDTSVNETFRRWFFGDALLLEDQSTDTSENPAFMYYPFNAFVDTNKSNLTVWLTALNDDSINVNSPTYNRCGYCEDTIIGGLIISTLEPKFSVSGDICRGDSITFYDSTTNEIGFIWKYFALSSDDRANAEYVLDTLFPKSWEEADLTKGYSLYFDKPNQYRITVIYRDSVFCDFRVDTAAVISIHSGSEAAFLSGKDTINFYLKRDTLCANNPDTLYFRDNSYTHTPFEETEIVLWEWILHNDTFFVPNTDTFYLPNTDTFYVQNPVYVDTIPGLYDVKLRVTNEHGCKSSVLLQEGYILVDKIKAMFAPLKTTYCNREEVHFVNQSYLQPYKYNIRTTFHSEWDWGDGTPVYRQAGLGDAFHVYDLPNYPDTINVTLTVSIDGMDCSDTYTASVIIVGPMANFTDDGHRFPCPDRGRQIQFYNTSTGDEPVWFYWNFGDTVSGIANESNLRDPVHDYFHAGTYDITLIVGDATGCKDTLFLPEYVFIDGPVGRFEYDELSGCVDHRVVFTPITDNVDTIIVNPDRANRLIRGGTQVNDTLSYVYELPGAYLPYFYLIKWVDNNGTMEQCVVQWDGEDSIYAIEIIPDFVADSLYCSRLPVVFPNTTVFSPTYLGIDSVIWLFGNGDSLRAIDGHTQYDTAGTYPVDMTVHVWNCSAQISKLIDVIDLPDTIYTGPDSASTCGSMIEVQFVADTTDPVSIGQSLQYKWLFDDGDTVDGNPVLKTFHSSGVYPYQLTVSFGMSNCIKTYFGTIVIFVHTPPVAEFEAIPQTVNYGHEIQFRDQSTTGDGNLTSWYWNFGDTTNSNEQHPAHTYRNTSGYKTVLLRIEDEFGCNDSIAHDVLVLESIEFPNLFTPVGLDGKKYVFKPIDEKGYYKEFRIDIYNRWGNSIWSNSCTDPNCPDYADSFWWDGYNKWGKAVEDGVYYWVVHAIPLSETEVVTKNGSVTVINSGK